MWIELYVEVWDNGKPTHEAAARWKLHCTTPPMLLVWPDDNHNRYFLRLGSGQQEGDGEQNKPVQYHEIDSAGWQYVGRLSS
jgi:hypothetical protein